MTPNTTGKERECCEKCEYRHFEEGYLTNDCRNEKCECHSPQSTKMKNEYIWRAVLDKILCGDLEEQNVSNTTPKHVGKPYTFLNFGLCPLDGPALQSNRFAES